MPAHSSPESASPRRSLRRCSLRLRAAGVVVGFGVGVAPLLVGGVGGPGESTAAPDADARRGLVYAGLTVGDDHG